MLSARGIPVVVGAENHSSMLGGLGGSFLSLDIWVAEEDGEEAAALLHDLREPGLSAGSHDLDDEIDDCDGRDIDDGHRDLDHRDIDGDHGFGYGRNRAIDALGDIDGSRDVGDPGDIDDASDSDSERDCYGERDCNGDGTALAQARIASDAFHLRIDRRRRTGIALLLGCCLTFGTAHMFTRAWLRGIALGALELIGILQIAAGHRAGTIAIVGAVATDVIGAVWRVWAAPAPVLPEARLRRR